MRKLILYMHMSLDGFAAGPNGELDWISYDAEMEKYAEGIVSSVGSPLYGRITYQMMESYWPTVLDDPSSASQHDQDHARWVEDVEKVVFSTTLEDVTWHNTRLIKENIVEEVNKLKQQPGKDLVIFGSPGLAESFMQLDLIDAFHLTLNPVILGQGLSFFPTMKDKINLRLIKSTTLQSGVITLYYEREKIS